MTIRESRGWFSHDAKFLTLEAEDDDLHLIVVETASKLLPTVAALEGRVAVEGLRYLGRHHAGRRCDRS